MILMPDNHILLSLSQELTGLCKPLESFGIHHFTYHKHFNDGSRINLSNIPQWIDDYFNRGLFQSSLFENNPANYVSGFTVWYGSYDLDVARHAEHYYNSSHSITITEKQEDGCEFYFFAAAANKAREISFLANNLEILHHFILYLKDKARNVFKQANKNRFMIGNEVTFLAIDNPYISDEKYHKKMLELQQQFFRTTHVYKYIFENTRFQGIKLSNRELDCIYYLLSYKTADETAKLMNISRRTVESYYDNIKIKLKLDNKNSLIEHLKPIKLLSAIR